MIKENVVKVPFRKLKYIHHISDIQIRNLKRHKEYEEVFERTYEEVKKHKEYLILKQNDQAKWKILDYYYVFKALKEEE